MLKKRESFTIGFRLDATHLATLEDEARHYSVSLHERARQIVIEHLDDAERGKILDKVIEVKESVSGVEGEVAQLRSDLAEAVEWMIKNLKKG